MNRTVLGCAAKSLPLRGRWPAQRVGGSPPPLNALPKQCGGFRPAGVLLHREAQFDKLTGMVQKNPDMEKVYRILKGE